MRNCPYETRCYVLEEEPCQEENWRLCGLAKQMKHLNDLYLLRMEEGEEIKELTIHPITRKDGWK